MQHFLISITGVRYPEKCCHTVKFVQPGQGGPLGMLAPECTSTVVGNFERPYTMFDLRALSLCTLNVSVQFSQALLQGRLFITTHIGYPQHEKRPSCAESTNICVLDVPPTAWYFGELLNLIVKTSISAALQYGRQRYSQIE